MDGLFLLVVFPLLLILFWAISVSAQLSRLNERTERIAKALGGPASISAKDARRIRTLIDQDRRPDALLLYRDLTGDSPEEAEAAVKKLDELR